jgi:hypothetical protein
VATRPGENHSSCKGRLVVFLFARNQFRKGSHREDLFWITEKPLRKQCCASALPTASQGSKCQSCTRVCYKATLQWRVSQNRGILLHPERIISELCPDEIHCFLFRIIKNIYIFNVELLARNHLDRVVGFEAIRSPSSEAVVHIVGEMSTIQQ